MINLQIQTPCVPLWVWQAKCRVGAQARLSKLPLRRTMVSGHQRHNCFPPEAQALRLEPGATKIHSAFPSSMWKVREGPACVYIYILLSNNIVQHTIRVQFNSCWMSLSTLWINRPWAWDCLPTVQKSESAQHQLQHWFNRVAWIFSYNIYLNRK